MEIPDRTYCRLCAKATAITLVYNLKYDKAKSLDIKRKLTRLKESFAEIFVNNKLPDTICLECLEVLDKSVSFVDTVELSQTVLKQMYGPGESDCTSEMDDREEGSDSLEDVCRSVETNLEGSSIKTEHIKKEMMNFEGSFNHMFEQINIPSYTEPEDTTKRSWLDYIWRCAICMSPFNSMELLRSHSMDAHQTCSAFRCIDCNSHKIEYTEFISHVVGHRQFLKNYCPVCNVDYEATGQTDAGHRKIHVPYDSVCGCCDMSFESLQALDAHKKTFCAEDRLEKSTDGADNLCTICNKVLSTASSLRNHLAMHAGRTRDFVCDVCGKCFYTKDTLAGHFRVHSDPRPGPYACEVCGKSYTTQRKLNNHSTMHTEGQRKSATEVRPSRNWKEYVWTCSVCRRPFPSFEDLRSHSMTSHQRCSAFRCSDCNSLKLKYDDIIAHIVGHRSNLARHCPICNVPYKSNTEKFVTHKSTHVPFEHRCVGCNLSFQTSKLLDEHKEVYCEDQRLRKRVDSKGNVCQVCNRSFKSHCFLRRHAAMHTGRRDYICNLCGKAFYTKSRLSDHILVHSDQRPHVCKICGMSFKRLVGLRKHTKTHNEERPFTCQVCHRSYKTEKMLKKHSLLHTEDPKHVCDICDKRFRERTILMRHYRQHTGVKPYSCEQCNRSFADRSNYGKHVMRKHGVIIAKKKYTPKGFFPVNPVTGEPEMGSLGAETLEWQRQLMAGRRARVKADAAPSYSGV